MYVDNGQTLLSLYFESYSTNGELYLNYTFETERAKEIEMKIVKCWWCDAKKIPKN